MMSRSFRLKVPTCIISSLTGVKFKCVIILVLYLTLINYIKVWKDGETKFIPRLKVTSYIIDTESCKIPYFDPFHPGLREFFGPDDEIVVCSETSPLTYQEGITLKVNKTVAQSIRHFSHCVYQGISRMSGNDFHINYTKKYIFTEDVEMTEEYIRVYCYDALGWNIYRNFHAFILSDNNRLSYLKEKHDIFKQTKAPKEIFNVMMIGIESLSRYNQIVKMPKTRDFLLNNLSSIELEGYNKVADNSMVNLTPILTGNFISEAYGRLNLTEGSHVDDFNFIFKKFSESGYLTLFAEDSPVISAYNYNTKGFRNQPVDFYLRPFTLSMEEDSSVWNNFFCVLDRPETNIILQYSEDFMMARNMTVPKFSYTFNTRLTHDELRYLSTADEYYYTFLQKLLKSGVLNNTILLVFGDHGFRMGPVMKTDFGKMQTRLPSMNFVLPSWFSQKYPEIYSNLKENQYRLTSPFDIHETLLDILHFTGIPRQDSKQKRRGRSLFDAISKKRTCEEAGIPLHWCTCKSVDIKGLEINDPIVKRSAEFVIKYMNKELARYPECSQLKLSSISSIHAYRQSEEIMYQKIVLKTTPGGGEFEVTVTYNEVKNNFKTDADSITRLNRYNSDGDCMPVNVLRPFCYCT